MAKNTNVIFCFKISPLLPDVEFLVYLHVCHQIYPISPSALSVASISASVPMVMRMPCANSGSEK